MAESLNSADAKDKQNSGDKDIADDMADWERRLAEGDLPEDFLEVTEPQNQSQSQAGSVQAAATISPPPATGLLVDIPTVTASNSVPQEKVPPPDSLQDKETEKEPRKPLSTEESDRALALELQRQLDLEASGGDPHPRLGGAPGMIQVVPANIHGRLTVTVAEAKLARNYGMSRMDPYCRVRIGHSVYETPTASNGAREPKWNKTFNIFLLKGTKNMDVEIYDECTFSNDAMIAHATFSIPESVFKFEVVDDWFPLSGQEGHEKEGVLHLIISLHPVGQNSVGQNISIPDAHPPVQKQPNLPTEEQLSELCKMFPNLDKEIITSVFAEKAGNQEEIVNVLLQMSSE